MRTTAVTILLLLLATSSFAQQFPVFFDHNKIIPTEESYNALLKLLRETSKDTVALITISGHTDPSGSDSYNLDLSEKRTNEIIRIIRQHWPEVKITSSFHGEQLPVSTDDAQNRRVEVTITYTQLPAAIQLQPYIQDAETQTFNIDLDDTVIIHGKEGTMIKISPGSIVKKDQTLMKGTAIAQLKEYYRPETIILAGMHTVSSEGLLQTGGMFSLVIVQNNDIALSRTRKPVEIRMPVNNPGLNNMNVFVQQHNNSDTAMWENTRQMFVQTGQHWRWPSSSMNMGKQLTKRGYDFNAMKPGRIITEDFTYRGRFLRRKPLMKKAAITVEKTDSTKLKAHATFRYRRKALRKMGTMFKDTTYTVPLMESQYYGFTQDLLFVNCDRYLLNPDPSELIVKTPGFEDARALVYLEIERAYVAPSSWKDGILFKSLPRGSAAHVIVMGKKNDDVYYAHRRYTTAEKITITLDLVKLTPEQCKKALELFVL